MRQRKAKDLEKRLEACREYMISDAESKQKKYFDGSRELFLEIGCGKGQFIVKKAAENPDADFIAVEGQETVILRALEKAVEFDRHATAEGSKRLPNLKFKMTFIHDMSEMFEDGQLSGIYLNFSDPWPKARHAKRRLTYRERLADYGRALKRGGFLEIKTDNDELYDFTLQELEAVGCTITEQTRDLHASGYDARLTTTEYEDKFSGRGKNINYVRAVFK